MEDREMTIKEAIELCINDLRTISIPAGNSVIEFTNSIALPVVRVIHNLENLSNQLAIIENNARAKAESEQQDEGNSENPEAVVIE